MDDFVPFLSRQYNWCFLMLMVARGMDILSTRVATPNLVLEGNPIAKALGWRWGILFNLVVCFPLAFWPVSAIAVATMSVLVAARNFQSAWLMRSYGEEPYRAWHVERMQETRVSLFLFCLAANTLLTASVGIALVCFSSEKTAIVPLAIGTGIIAYAGVVAFYTLLAVWRLRRATGRQLERRQQMAVPPVNGSVLNRPELKEACACESPTLPGK